MTTSSDSRTPIRLTRVSWETPHVHRFQFEGLDGRPLHAWEAGAHINVYLPNGLVRAYSLCGVPSAAPSCYEIAVKCEASGRGGSAAIHELRVGCELQISAPRNVFALSDTACHALLLGGGIGITPLVAMAHQLHQVGREFTLAVFARTRESLPLRTILENSAWRHCVSVHLDDEAEPVRPADLIERSPLGCHVYFCGPAGFMEGVQQATKHWSPDRVHFEYFQAPAVSAPVPLTTAEPTARSFNVHLARRNMTLAVPHNQTIAHVLQSAGVPVDTVCEQGICGSCVTPYLEGHPAHKDMCLAESERASNIALCCSRSVSDLLTLDL